jgi:hypothetical protein
MYNKFLFKPLLFIVSILLFVSCDKEYSAVGDALIGENHFELAKYTSSVIAHNEKVTPIQSSNLPINALGIYDNPAFGKTIANFSTQLTLASVNPTFGSNPVIDSVYIDVPYFSTKLSIDASGNSTYELDSIYGEPKAKIKLSVFESGRYMGTQSGTAQTFYTDQNAEFDNLKIGNRLNDDSNKEQNDEFFFDPKEHKFNTTSSTGTVTTTRTPPSMRLKLNIAFFTSKIINAPAGSLATNDVFINYFKGLYFKVEQSGTDKGSLAMINFAKGSITIKYKEDSSTTPVTRVDKTIILNMSGSTANLLEQSNTNTDYDTATSNPNRVIGDEKLYLKGGEGSLAVIDLFEKKDLLGYDSNGNVTGPNGVSDELDNIRKEGWLINEANLVFNIDATTMAKSYEPNRIYLYDYTNNRPVVDYYLDGTSAVQPKKARFIFDGNLNTSEVTKRGTNYKIRITNHIRNLVKHSDSTNVKLGVVVTESIDIANSYNLKTPSIFISEAPKASVMNPLGTVLYGGRSTSNPTDTNLLKLEIYYTKPK